MPGTKLEVIIVTLFIRNGNQPVSGMFNRSRSPSLPERFSNDQRKSPGFQDLRRGEESAPMIIVRITMKVLPEKQKEVMQTLVSMIEPEGREKGCLSYDVFCDMEDETIHSLIEEWETREDLDRHLASKNFRVLLGAESLLGESLGIQIHTVSRSEGIEAVNAARGISTSFFPTGVERRNRI